MENKMGNFVVKAKVCFMAIILVAVFLVIALVWYQGHKIQKLKEDIAEKDAQIEEYLNNPIVVSPIAPEISLDVINSEIKEIGELATTEYLYTNAAKFTDSKQIKNWNIPGTEKSFLIKWDGVIKAGIDVNEVTTAVDNEKKVLTVYLPNATILSHDPDKESVEVLDESDGLFNPVRLEDQIKVDAESEKAMEERAIENGLLEKAQMNAEGVIFRLLNANPDIKGNYTIEFQTSQK